MEFHVKLGGTQADLRAIEAAVLAADPAALVDLEASGNVLRIAGAFTALEVNLLLGQSGHPVSPAQVEQLPSVCCGGCSG